MIKSKKKNDEDDEDGGDIESNAIVKG